jgi:hypothetical protein
MSKYYTKFAKDMTAEEWPAVVNGWSYWSKNYLPDAQCAATDSHHDTLPLGNYSETSPRGSMACYVIRAEAVAKKFDHLVICLDSDKPPGKLMTAKQAHVVAEKMAKEHRGKRFHVAKLVEYCEAPPEPVATWGKL